jgi:hypothetical protein
MCRLADLFNLVKNVFAFPFVNRHPEGLTAVRVLTTATVRLPPTFAFGSGS